MEDFWRRHQWGDRWLAAVGGLMALAAVALVGIAILVAHRVDTDSTAREVDTVRNGVASTMARMRKDLRALSRWDETVPQGVSRNDASWIHRNFGRRMHETSGYDQTYLLNGSGAPVYASINGKMVDKNIYEVVEESVRPIIAAP